MSATRAWRDRPPGLSLHLGQEFGSTPRPPAWLPRPHRVERVRIGSSLCPRLLPPLDRLRHAAGAANRRGARLELETPPLGDDDLDRLRLLLDELERICPGADVVVNDWGALRTLRREHPDLVPVIGRVLHRQMRDPRIPATDPQRLDGRPRSWGLGSAASRSWTALVRRWSVCRVEFDWPLHGLDREVWSGVDLDLTLHLPLVVVAAGRSCLLRDPRGAVDRVDGGERCDLSCAHTAVHLEAPWVDAAGGHPSMIRLGNAELARLDADALEAAVDWVEAPGGPDRIAVFPGVP